MRAACPRSGLRGAIAERRSARRGEPDTCRACRRAAGRRRRATRLRPAGGFPNQRERVQHVLVRRRLRSHFAGRRQGLFRLAGALQHDGTQRKRDVHAGVLLRGRAPAGADASAAAGAGAEG